MGFRTKTDFIQKSYRAAGGLGANDLPPVLDFESSGGKSPSELTQMVNTWLTTVEKTLHRTPMIYCSLDFANENLTDPSLSKYLLWLAEYGVSKPTVPNIWKSKGWTIWQNSESGTVPGVPGGNGQTDLDILNGGKSALRSLTR